MNMTPSDRRMMLAATIGLTVGLCCACTKTADAPVSPQAAAVGAANADNQAVDGRAAGVVEITFRHPLEGPAAEALERTVREFDESRQDLTVKIVAQARSGQERRVVDDILAGNGPDVFLAGDAYAREWMERRRILEPLNQLATARGVDPGSAWQATYVSRLTSDSLLYGVPLAISVPVLVANPEKVLRNCDMAASPAANAGRPIAIDITDWRVIEAFFRPFAGGIVDGAGTPVFDNPDMIAAITFLSAQITGGGLIPVNGAAGLIEAFNSGSVAAIIARPDQVPMISTSRPMIIMPMPNIQNAKLVRVTPSWQVDALFMSSWTRHREAAADLIFWLASERQVDSLARDGLPGLLPPKGGLPSEYLASMLSRGVRAQQLAATPSPDFVTTGTAFEIFVETVAPLLNDASATPEKMAAVLTEGAARARAAVTKMKQSSSIILR